jgi:hypothetical protein
MNNLILEEIRKLKHEKNQPERSKPDLRQYFQENQSQKSNSNSGSLQNKEKTNATQLHLFKGLSFCFPAIDIDLSPKRIQCMATQIKEEDGKVIAFHDKQIDQPVDYLLVNPKLPLPLLLRKINNKIKFKEILDYNFVLHCLREQILLAISNYSLYKNRQF